MSDQKPWLREYDALIAERAEGLHPRKENGIWVVEHRERGGEAGWHGTVVMSSYYGDLAAIARAQESWRAQDADLRWYWCESPGVEIDMFHARCLFGVDRIIGEAEAPTESAARAWALLLALGGGA